MLEFNSLRLFIYATEPVCILMILLMPPNLTAHIINMQIRVSSEISNGQIILNVDCDMYSNNSLAVRDALCFFMDDKKGQEIAYVQFPQNFDNLTKNELYSSSLRVLSQVSIHVMFCAHTRIFSP